MDGAAARSDSLRWLTSILIGLPLTACAPGFGGNASGTYVGKGSNAAILVQIVQADGGQLTGRYEEVILQPSGKLDDTNASVNGAINGQTVVMTIKPIAFLAGSFPVSGTIQMGHLHLSGGGNGVSLVRDLRRSDEASFRTQVAHLSEQGGKIIAEQARLAAEQAQRDAARRKAQTDVERLAQLQGAIQRMTNFVAQADVMLPKFATVEQSYRDFTRRMQGGLNREQGIIGNGQASVARGQLSVAINQVSMQANQAHMGVQNTLSSVGVAAAPLAKEAIAFEQNCSDKTHSDQGDWDDACARFADADRALRDRIAALQTAFNEAEGVWATERPNQEAIVQASNRAVG